ncbi:hypothetical protein [Bathymodiolus heckerae thiotrophic gill symbiont]|uniref:hypothetical protein n=1 Tax=Bathymodiolus heckerae thiotrophic gill symbiont TaxID=1052212 RepID=UPI001BB24751|nr:hypothetical protein [Bathymodiolus heckerae thiotrophic gill symbiont]
MKWRFFCAFCKKDDALFGRVELFVIDFDFIQLLISEHLDHDTFGVAQYRILNSALRQAQKFLEMTMVACLARGGNLQEFDRQVQRSIFLGYLYLS